MKAHLSHFSFPAPVTSPSIATKPAEAMQTRKVIDLLTQILSQIQISSTDKRLWSVDDIAAYMGLSVSSVRNRVTCKLDFPRAIKMKGFNRRWYASEVRDWIIRFREKH